MMEWEQGLNPDVTVPYLRQERIFNETDYQRYTHLPSTMHQNQYLIDKLRCARVEDFQKFCNLLESNPKALLAPEECSQIGRLIYTGQC